MALVFLDVPFSQKETAKALGARFDWASKRWFVPPGVDPAAFSRWIPAASQAPDSGLSVAQDVGARVQSTALAEPRGEMDPVARALATTRPTPDSDKSTGRALSALLAEISQTLAQRFSDPIWVRADVAPFEARRGHVYLDLVENNDQGQELARARALIWSDDRDAVIGKFETATGIRFAGGLKVLVRATVSFHARFGLSLNIREIDPDYTIGELALRRRRIREQLIQDGIYAKNRTLALPGDFFSILVIAPDGAAGLGDFRKEADRLERLGLCRFVYRVATFQGPRASESLSAVLREAGQWAHANGADAIALLRGGGASADLHWLDDLEIARALCLAPVPVLIGVGHERDQTILDELARWVAGTPSKLIQFVEATIAGSAAQAQDAYDAILTMAARAVQRAQAQADQWQAVLTESARARCQLADQSLDHLRGRLRDDVWNAIDQYRHQIDSGWTRIESGAAAAVRVARHAVEALWQRVGPDAWRQVDVAQALMEPQWQAARRGAWRQWDTANREVRRDLAQVIGLGPRRTLQRGFVIVRSAGRPIPSVANLAIDPPPERLSLEFRDGVAEVILQSQRLSQSDPTESEWLGGESDVPNET